jgi:hypothetical protein
LLAIAAGIAHYLGIVTISRHGIGLGIDGSEHVEIQEAVIDRRHQRVGHGMCKPHQIAVDAGRIDHDEVKGPLHRADGVHELLQLGVFILGDLHGPTELDAAVHRELEIKAGAARPGAAIIDVTGKTLLPAVEIDGGDPLAGLHQGDGNVQRHGGFARSTLLVAQHHDVRRAGLSLASLHQHLSTPANIIKSRVPAVK